MSVVDVLAAASGRPEDIALVGPDSLWSYAELGALVDARAAKLRREGDLGERGLGEVDGIVPLVVDPDADGVVELLAWWRLGAIPAPLNPRLTEAELEIARAALDDVRPPRGAQVILWTSGTAGRPRGVALSWDNLSESTAIVRERLSLEPSDVWLASLAAAHVGGLALIVRALLLGGCLIAVGGFDVARVSAMLDGDELPERAPAPTHLSLVPTQLHRLLEYRRGLSAPSRVKCALIGGAHAPASLVARAHAAGWPIALTYGATEMTSQIATAPPVRVREKPGAVGRPLGGVDVRLSEDGELLTRGATQALGYVGPRAGELTDDEGWYHTGDLGRVDEDGDLWITGRRIDRIVSGGVTVDAAEVEEAVRAHPCVLDVCVVGVPDPEWGEKVAAWVEPVVGEFELEDVELHVREVLAPAKRPRLWHVAPQIPRNANGKADRRRVRSALESAAKDA